ncbi:MAG TPA: glycoside hydrolase family 38 C-terminal domain-containing protein, partial [Bacteroidales bacterium]|nr:glycoside hydrolase family 38 C-terminal domain-containing protein [Bacteroidales bacterium]
NGFSEVLKNSVASISRRINTETDGRAVIVYNPVPMEREDIVTAELSYSKLPANVKVFDKSLNQVPSQIISTNGNRITVIFLAKLASAGLSVFEIKETTEKPAASSLSVTNQSLENEYFRVSIDANGDIAGIYDKKAAREVLSKPATLDFQQEQPKEWPSWNMDWKDRKNPPIDYMNKNVKISIVENGPVRVALSITKSGLNSEITQIVSLATGEPGKVIEVQNAIDWQSKEVSLKAAFPTTVVNEFATYSLNTAAVKRTTNNDVKFEVPGRQWIDITDKSNSYGVSILEDCKYGSDKPDNSTLRLTLMYTPKANSFVYQGTQDWGIHNVRYGIYPHSGDWAHANTPWRGYFLNNPPIAFETASHPGRLGREVSLIKSNTSQIDVMAFKKAEEGNYYIVRVNELYGKEAKGVSLSFPGIVVDAYEVNGQEKKIGSADFTKGTLNFDMTGFLIRTFAIKLGEDGKILTKPVQASVDLPYNEDGISFDNNRKDGNILNGMTIPAEMLPQEVVSEDITFKLGNNADGKKNMVAAKGQKLTLPAGEYNKIYLLAAATEDTRGEFKAGNKVVSMNFQNWTGYVGQHYGRVLSDDNLKVLSINDAFTKRDNIAWFSSHRHTPEANDAYQYSYLFKYEISIPEGTRSVTLPNNSKIKILAVTVADNKNDDVMPLQVLYDDFSSDKPVKLRKAE